MGFLGLSGQWRVECTIHYRQVADAGEDYNLKSISFDLGGSRHQTLQTLDSELSDMKTNILPPLQIRVKAIISNKFININISDFIISQNILPFRYLEKVASCNAKVLYEKSKQKNT